MSPNSPRCPRLTQDARSSQVIAAAIRLFAQKGFQGTKTKEIADAAGINEALIFRDFQSKEKLYCAILEYASNRMNVPSWIEELKSIAASQDDHAVFCGLAQRIFSAFSNERELYRLMLYSALENHELARKFRERQCEPLERFIEEYVSGRQATGAYREGNPHDTARCFLNLCHHHILRHILFGTEVEPTADEKDAQTIVSLFLDGVRASYAISESHLDYSRADRTQRVQVP